MTRQDKPSMDIEEILKRRSDLSTFVVHFTRDWRGSEARANLESILRSETIEARSSGGWVGDVAAKKLKDSKVVCFSETPLEYAHWLVQDIAGRKVKLSPHGLAFTKSVARKKSVNTVWYVDMTPGQRAQWAIKKALDELKEQARDDPGGFASHPAGRILPFIDQMGTWIETKKEFWWEREWRHLGHFSFSWTDVAFVFCPEDEIEDFEEFGPPAVDPSWSLEQMIEKLAQSSISERMERRRRRKERLAPLDDW